MTDTIRDLLISLASHMAYMQGQLEAHHEHDDPEDYYWYRESVLLRQKVTDELLADEPAAPEGREPAAVTGQPSDQELLDIAASTIEPYERSGIATDEYEPETESAVEAYGSELIAFARAVLARWGNLKESLTSSPPADGEVAECAAELLQWQAPVPVAVSERLPEPNVKVLAHYFNSLGNGRTICAIWVPAKTRSDSYGNDDFTEYDEEADIFYWPEGWYEAIENWDDLGWVKVDEGEVVYWQPLPKWPAHALPRPEVSE